MEEFYIFMGDADFRLIFDAAPAPMFIYDQGSLKFIEVNEAALREYGYSREEFLAMKISDIRMPEEGLRFGKELEDSTAPALARLRGVRHICKDGTCIDVEIIRSRFSWNGRICGLVNVYNITETKRLRHELAVERDRSGVLAKINRMLSEGWAAREGLEALASIAVTEICDWITMDIVEPGGGLRRMVDAHAEPEMRETLDELKQRYIPVLRESHPLLSVLRDKKPIVVSRVSSEHIDGIVYDEGHRRVLERLGFGSYVVVPLKGREGISGIVSFLSRDQERYSEADVDFLERVVQCAAQALDYAALVERSRRAIEARDEFLSIASHELRTPLTTLLGTCHLMARTAALRPDTPISKLDEILRRSIHEGKRLGDLLNDLLDLASLRGENIPLDLTETDVAAIAREVLGELTTEAAESDTSLVSELDQSVFGMLDPIRVRQVVRNLVSNALKYAPGKPVRVRVERQGGFVRIIVHDNGPGIAVDDQEAIFNRFSRADTHRSVRGTGLGLYIVRQIVHAHHGIVRVQSVPGFGATFVVELPISTA